MKAALAFGVPALLLALPWYLKNLLWFNNPFYPLYIGGPDWSARGWRCTWAT